MKTREAQPFGFRSWTAKGDARQMQLTPNLEISRRNEIRHPPRQAQTCLARSKRADDLRSFGHRGQTLLAA